MILFTDEAFKQYTAWYKNDSKKFKKINELILDIKKSGDKGSPKALHGLYKGCFSRRIDLKNRLVYTFDDKNELVIMQCTGHYDDK